MKTTFQLCILFLFGIQGKITAQREPVHCVSADGVTFAGATAAPDTHVNCVVFNGFLPSEVRLELFGHIQTLVYFGNDFDNTTRELPNWVFEMPNLKYILLNYLEFEQEVAEDARMRFTKQGKVVWIGNLGRVYPDYTNYLSTFYLDVKVPYNTMLDSLIRMEKWNREDSTQILYYFWQLHKTGSDYLSDENSKALETTVIASEMTKFVSAEIMDSLLARCMDIWKIKDDLLGVLNQPKYLDRINILFQKRLGEMTQELKNPEFDYLKEPYCELVKSWFKEHDWITWDDNTLNLKYTFLEGSCK